MSANSSFSDYQKIDVEAFKRTVIERAGIPLRRGISPSAGNRKRQGILGLPKTFASHSTVTLELADSVVPSEPSSHVDSLALSHPVDAFTPTTPPNTPAVWNGFTGYSHGHRHPIPANSNPQIGGNMENAGDSKESFKEPSENCSHSSKLYADMRGNGQGDIFDEQRQHAHSLNQKLFAVQEQKSPVGYGANEFQQGDWNGYVVSKSVLPSINISLPTEMRAEETSLNVKKIETLNESIQSSGKETERSYYYARFSTDSLSSSQKSSTTSTEHFEQHYTTDSTGKQDNDLPQKQQTVSDKKTTDSKDGVSLRENANKEMQELHYSENEIGNEDSSERREHIDMPEIEDWEDYTEGSLFSRQRWNGKDRDEVLDAWERRSKMTASSKLNSKKSVNSNVNKQRLSSSPSVKPSVVIETHQKQAEQLAPVLWEDVALNISSDATTAQESAKQEVDNSSSKVPQDPVKSSMLPKSAPSLLLRTLQSPFSAMKSVTKGRPTILPEAEKQNDSMPDKQMAPNSNAPLPPAVYSTEQQPSVPAGRVAPNLNNPRAAWNEPTKVAKIVNAPVPPNAWNVQQSAAPNLSQQTRATLWNGQAVGQASETPSTLNQQMRSNSLNTQPSTAQNSYTQLPLQTTESKSSPAQQRPQTLGSGQLKLQLPTETARPGQPATSPTYAVPDMAKKTRQKVPIPQPPPKPKNSSLRNAYRKYIGKVMGTGTKLNHYTDDDDTISDEDKASATSTTESDYLTTAAIDASTPANNKEDDGNAAAKKREIAYIPTSDASTHESPHSASLHAAPRDAPADFISSGRREEAMESGGQKSVTQQQKQLNDRRRPSMELEEQLHGPIGSYWAGQRLRGRALDSRTPLIKNYWEQNIRKAERERNEYPKANRVTDLIHRSRSNETLSAKSLLDSQDNLNGRTSQEEYSTLDSFNRADGKKKTYLEELLTPKGGGQLKAGKSLDSLTMQVERQQPWYDRGQIKAAISRESIANLGATRGLFESRAAAAAAEQSAATPPTYRPLNHIQRDIQYSQAKELEHRLNRSEQMSNGHHQQHNHRDVIHSNDVTPDGEHNSVMNQSGLDTQAIKQNGHHHSPKQNGSTVTTPVQSFEASFSQEQELFLLYIKANPEILSSLGIAIPGQLRQRINDMPPSMKRVELTLVSDYGTPTDSTAGSLDRRHQGRFVKNSTGSAHRMIARKMSDHTMQMTRPTPENRRPIMLELDEQKAGESLIAAEIRTLREREDELKRSRSELGLPSLEDTIDYWRHGLASKPTSLPLRGAQSYDHLHWAVGSETPSNMSISIKSESLDHLHALNENGVNGHHNNYQPQREQTNGHLPTKQSHEIGYNLAVHPNRSSQLNSHRYRAPMEARIEAEVIEDQRREAELRAQRGELSPQNRLLASTTPDGLSELSDSSGGGHSAGEPLQREYIGQRNPTFRPAYSSSAYKLHRSDDPDVMIYGPSSTRRSNGSTIHLISSPTLSQGMRTIRYE